MTEAWGKYHGREQSYIKHRFLAAYLQAAAYKIFQSRSHIFNFVDAFAGPWSSSDKDYSDTSFYQAVSTLEDVRTQLSTKGYGDLKIRFCFCEKQRDAFDRLRQYADQHDSFEIHVFHGLFEENLGEIASVCHDGFTFTFIDPTGWNIRFEPILQFLRARERGEFLLNFMAEDISRWTNLSKVSASYGRFLADPDWKDYFDSLPLDWNNEKRILYLLKHKIKESKAATYLPDFSILKPRQDRVKMRLILGTHSAIGLEVFRNVQGTVERKEIEMRNQLRNVDDRQASLFTEDEDTDVRQENTGVGCKEFQRKAKEKIIQLLEKKHTTAFKNIAVSVLEDVSIQMKQVKKLVMEMKKQDVISFKLPPRKRLPQPNTSISLC